ncbi:hypothetical protein ABZX93_20130 [Streptomyces sp. NPDC006632]|uniref:hypothetical protein n=1 Tax=unclassified Streptomyces TaxID=2593676 RepID=UPI002E1D5A66
MAQLLYMAQAPDRALWVAWGEGVDMIDMEVRCLPICRSTSPTKELACWLPVGHRGGHAWERYA